ncbi:hypothetical protein B0H11DRAFT_1925000 [Mycena galericulata]|nr:hypothetical protein B0H11DRAFT_1925000 [Mycena galericulata]
MPLIVNHELTADATAALLLSALRAAAWVEEARRERDNTGGGNNWPSPRALAERALQAYVRSRQAKLARPRRRRSQRLTWLHKRDDPTWDTPWAPSGWLPPLSGCEPSGDWSAGHWHDNHDPARLLTEADDEISPLVVSKPLPPLLVLIPCAQWYRKRLQTAHIFYRQQERDFVIFLFVTLTHSSATTMPARKPRSSPMAYAHPPMKSRYISGPSDLELKAQRHFERNEKARLRMARTRAALKLRPLEEQQAAAARSREYQKTYRERHRDDLRVWEAMRRVKAYKERFGVAAYAMFLKARRDCKRRKRQKAAAKEAYHDNSSGDAPDGSDDGDV